MKHSSILSMFANALLTPPVGHSQGKTAKFLLLVGLLLCAGVQVKAQQDLNFLWESAPSNVPTGGNFSFSGNVGGAVSTDGAPSGWVGFAGNVTATSRAPKRLVAGNGHKFILRIQHKENQSNFQMPKIKIGTAEPVGIADGNLTAYEAVNLEYNIDIASTDDYTIQVITQSGDKDKFWIEYLRIPASALAPPCVGESVTVNVNDGDMGSAEAARSSYCAGEQVNITATQNPGYRFVNWTTSSGVTFDNASARSTHFTMPDPAVPVTVTANFEETSCSAILLIEAEDYIDGYSAYHLPTGDEQIENDGALSGGKYINFNGSDDGKDGEINYCIHLPAATYSVEIKHKNGKDKYLNIYEAVESEEDATYNDVKYKKMSSYSPALGDDWCDWKTYTLNNVELSAGDYLIGLYGKQYAMFDYIKFTANSDVFCNYTISMADGVNGGNPTSDVASAAEGATVTVTAGAPDDGYYFSGWSASPAVEFDNASASPAHFTMPASNVTVTATYSAYVTSALTYSATTGGSISSVTDGGNAVASGDNVRSGNTVSIVASSPDANYVFTGWTAVPAVTFANASALSTTFAMPANAVAITANYAQVDNVISVGSETGASGDVNGGGGAISGTNVQDFDVFGTNVAVAKLSYSGMSGNAYGSYDLGKSSSYNSAASAGATGFGFYYKTEAAGDNVAMWFEPNSGGQQPLQLSGTSNVWKYVYFAHAEAATWNQSNIRIYINGQKEENAVTYTTASPSGNIYIAQVAATSITLKPDIEEYVHSREVVANRYYTVCLPMAGSISGATLYSIAGKEEEAEHTYVVLEDRGTTLVAGEPYIFEASGTEFIATMSGMHSAVNASANGLVGTYSQIAVPEYNGTDVLTYILSNNELKAVGDEVYCGAYRAYLNFGAVGAYNPAPGRRYVRLGIGEKEDVPQAVEQNGAEAVRCRKVLIDGALYIIRDGRRYTILGQ